MIHLQKLRGFVLPYWRRSVVALACLTAVIGMDLAIPRLIQHVIDQGVAQRNLPVVVQTSALMVGISILSALFAIGNNAASIRVSESVARDLREAIFLKLQSFSYGNLDRHSTGKLMVRLSSDTAAVQRIVLVTLRIGTRAPLLMIGSLILMVNTNGRLALTLLPLLLVTLAVIIFFSLKMESLYLAVQARLDRLNTVLQENIAGVRLVKAFARADFEAERFAAANRDFTERTIEAVQYGAVLTPALTVCVNLGIVLVLWAGGLQTIQGNLTVGQIVAFTNYMLTTLAPLTMMGWLATLYANGIASAQRVNEVLDTVPEVQDDPEARPLPDRAPGRVVFEGVGFHYDGAHNGAVLEDVSLRAEPGETVAILGATGAGKSTLVNLIPRFYEAASGRVTVDGVDVRCLEQDSLLALIAVVPQETILFSGSVRDNIRYGRPEATEEEVVAAAQAAQAHDFILALPRGYDTHVEERGVNLSGGQKQRLAIARALAARPRILILDDSTSSVDVETETKIQAALAGWMRGRTSLVVAQRISTVLNADRILVLDKGRIVAAGTHAELMQSSDIYREIYDSQLGEGLVEE
jgi:ATP-binding cassette subfamily B protein